MEKAQPSLASEEKRTIEKQIKTIVSELAGIRPHRLNPAINLRDELGIDSFTALEIIVAIEKGFKLLIGEKQIKKLITFQDLIDYVFKNQNRRG